MKVSTDACLLGAAANLASATRLLDIGTGTGLLALMAAQRHPTVEIVAIEIDKAAAAQAAANAAASTWASRLAVHACSLAEYTARLSLADADLRFSHIICNPPFFKESMPSADAARNTARHVSPESLSFEELTEFSVRFLAPGGRLTVLLPPPEMVRFAQAALAAGLARTSCLLVRHRPGGRVTRHISEYGRDNVALQERELLIHPGTGPEYTEAFRALLAGFYLAF
ncbi:hypothetical protein BEN48_13180 [Hymenobacter glacialis]|uniref:Methyltransferase small domain-containing protein n=2 Tax=Hymenobacter glacialis TaxID=1908236 RepID=A0A1G1T5K9_9BACT|nr:hypothetical protein BEN48_13180 [Hymenobacter glacialis]